MAIDDTARVQLMAILLRGCPCWSGKLQWRQVGVEVGWNKAGRTRMEAGVGRHSYQYPIPPSWPRSVPGSTWTCTSTRGKGNLPENSSLKFIVLQYFSSNSKSVFKGYLLHKSHLFIINAFTSSLLFLREAQGNF